MSGETEYNPKIQGGGEPVGRQTLHLGDNSTVLADMESDSLDFAAQDPPYGLGEITDLRAYLADWLGGGDGRAFARGGFMNREWDRCVPGPAEFAAQFRVLKPGAHMALFCGTRNFDLMCLSARLAGFEVRDTLPCHGLLAFVHGQGFPKSKDAGKALDAAAGAAREVVGVKPGVGGENMNDHVRGVEARDTEEGGAGGIGAYGVGAKQRRVEVPVTAAATPEAARWAGYGTALKPATELILLLRKPLAGALRSEIHDRTGWRRWYTKNEALRWAGRPGDEKGWEASPCAKVCRTYGGKPFRETLEDGRERRWVTERRWLALSPEEFGGHSYHFDGDFDVIAESTPFTDDRIVNLAANLIRWGTGGLNVDACRIAGEKKPGDKPARKNLTDGIQIFAFGSQNRAFAGVSDEGRWPPNTLLSHAPTCRRRAGGSATRGENRPAENGHRGVRLQNSSEKNQFRYEGAGEEWECDRAECIAWQAGAQGQFFPALQTTEADLREFFRYQAKPGKSEKEAGLDELSDGTLHRTNPGGMEADPKWAPREAKNTHVTVKPVALMEWILRLLCPPAGPGDAGPVGLDAYMGSGTTLVAAERLGVRMHGAECDPRSFEIARGRVAHAAAAGPSPLRESYAAAFQAAAAEFNAETVANMAPDGTEGDRVKFIELNFTEAETILADLCERGPEQERTVPAIFGLPASVLGPGPEPVAHVEAVAEDPNRLTVTVGVTPSEAESLRAIFGGPG